MSTPRGFSQNGKSLYSNVTKPCEVNLQFKVTPTNGLGVTSVKSNGYVRNVFMHTSTTPTANDGYTNPNPSAGYALIQLNNNFNTFLNFSGNITGATTSNTTSTNSGLTAGAAYVITVLGNTTLAQWQSIGLPAGLTPTVGQSFIATSTGTGGSDTGKLGLPAASGISVMELVGDPTQSSESTPVASTGGAWVLISFLGPSTSAVSSTLTMNSYTPAGTITNGTPDTFAGTPAVLTGSIVNSGGATTLTATAPSAGSQVDLKLYFDGSGVTIDGL